MHQLQRFFLASTVSSKMTVEGKMEARSSQDEFRWGEKRVSTGSMEELKRNIQLIWIQCFQKTQRGQRPRGDQESWNHEAPLLSGSCLSLSNLVLMQVPSYWTAYGFLKSIVFLPLWASAWYTLSLIFSWMKLLEAGWLPQRYPSPHPWDLWYVVKGTMQVSVRLRSARYGRWSWIIWVGPFWSHEPLKADNFLQLGWERYGKRSQRDLEWETRLSQCCRREAALKPWEGMRVASGW